MNVLITGGAGFICSYLAEKPLKEGYEVKVPHNLSSGLIENLYRITGKTKTVEGDYRNRRDLCLRVKIDMIGRIYR